MHWIGLTLALGIILGLTTSFFSHHSEDEAGFLATITGIIIFAAGLAYYLQLSPLLLTLVIGVVTANSSSRSTRLFEILSHYDQAVFMMLLILAGALLDVPIAGLVPLLLLYISLRLFGKMAGNRLAITLLPHHCRRSDRFMLPQGALTLALAIHQFQTYGDPTAAAVFQLLLLGTIFFSYLAPLLLGGWRR
jgi:Kef-type K+ transport system membrane component KefB